MRGVIPPTVDGAPWVEVAVDSDENASKITTLLKALGYRVALRTDDEDRRRRWALEQLARDYRLGATETRTLEQILAGVDDLGSLGAALGIGPRTASHRRGALLTLLGVNSCEAVRELARETVC